VIAVDDAKKQKQAPDPNDLHEMRVRRDSPLSGSRDAFLELRREISKQIQAQLHPDVDRSQRSQIRPFVHDRLDVMLEERGIVLNRSEKRQLLEAIVTDITSAQP
jgi:hypothetical protein